MIIEKGNLLLQQNQNDVGYSRIKSICFIKRGYRLTSFSSWDPLEVIQSSMAPI